MRGEKIERKENIMTHHAWIDEKKWEGKKMSGVGHDHWAKTVLTFKLSVS